MRKLVILTIAAIVCFIMSCKKSSTDDYFPMSVGSQWNYEGYTLYGTTTPPTDTMETTTSTIITQAKTTLTSGEEVIPFQNTQITRYFFPIVETDTIILTSYVREADDAILSYDSTSDTTPDTLLMLPLETGKTWHYGSVTALVVGQEDVTVEAGTYKNAWKIKFTIISGSYTRELFQWYAKDIGQVKLHSEYTGAQYNMINHLELLSATIK